MPKVGMLQWRMMIQLVTATSDVTCEEGPRKMKQPTSETVDIEKVW